MNVRKKAGSIGVRRNTWCVGQRGNEKMKMPKKNVLVAVKEVIRNQQNFTVNSQPLNLKEVQSHLIKFGFKTKGRSFFSSKDEKHICEITKWLHKNKPVERTTWFLRKIAYMYAEKSTNNCVFEWQEEQLAGVKWSTRFKQRNGLVLRLKTHKEPIDMKSALDDINDAFHHFETKMGKAIGSDVLPISLVRTVTKVKEMLAAFDGALTESKNALVPDREKMVIGVESIESGLDSMMKIRTVCKTLARRLDCIIKMDFNELRTQKESQSADMKHQAEKTMETRSMIQANRIAFSATVATDANDQQTQDSGFDSNVEMPNDEATKQSRSFYDFGAPLLNGEYASTSSCSKPSEQNDGTMNKETNATGSSDVGTISYDYDDEVEYMGYELMPMPICKIRDSVDAESAGTSVKMEFVDDEVEYMGYEAMPVPICEISDIVDAKSAGISIKTESVDDHGIDPVSGMMKFDELMKENGEIDKFFGHVGVTISHACYDVLRRLNTDSNNIGGYDALFMRAVLRAIFDVGEISKMNGIDLQDKRMEFASELFAVRVGSDYQRFNKFEEHVLKFIEQQQPDNQHVSLQRSELPIIFC